MRLSPFENPDLHRVLMFARMEAVRLGAAEIDTGHVLLGLLQWKSGLVKRLLSRVAIPELRDALSQGATRIGAKPSVADVALAVDAESAVAFASEEAERHGRRDVSPEYLLLAVLREARVATLMRPLGVTVETVRAAIDERLRTPFVLTVADSPVTELTLVRYDPATHAEFVGMLAELPPLQGAAGHAAVFTNLSQQPMTAMVVRWTVIAHDGVSKTQDVVRDDYSHLKRNRERVGIPGDSLAPGDRLFVTLDGFYVAIDVSQPHCYFFAGNVERLADDAAAITVSLDSAVFPDGRVVGPDAHGIGDDLHGRFAAAQELVDRLDQAEANGNDIETVLIAVVNDRSSGNKHLRRLALSGRPSLRHGGRESFVSWLNSLRTMPEPPRFFRSG